VGYHQITLAFAFASDFVFGSASALALAFLSVIPRICFWRAPRTIATERQALRANGAHHSYTRLKEGAEKLNEEGFVKGHDFSRANKPTGL
jgi:hypothetical protein